MVTAEERKYYNYIYCDPRKPTPYKIKGVDIILPAEPFYVGRGKGDRKYAHINRKSAKDCNAYKANKISAILKKGLNPIILVVASNLTVQEANEQEKYLIRTIGRIDKKNGTLTNLTDGGDGYTGWVATKEYREKRSKRYSGEGNPNFGKKMSDEAKRSISKKAKERFLNPENNPMFGKHHSKETKKKISESRENLSEETRIKMSHSAKSRPPISEKTRQKISSVTSGHKNGMYGKVHSEETKRKLSISAKNRKPTNTKPVLQYSLKGIFIKEWPSKVLVYKNGFYIDRAVSGEYSSACGCIWIYKNQFSKELLSTLISKNEK